MHELELCDVWDNSLGGQARTYTTSETQIVSTPVISQLPNSLQIGIVCLRARSVLLLKLLLGSSSVPVIFGPGSLLCSLLDLGN